MNKNRTLATLLLVTLLGGLLAACGGGPTPTGAAITLEPPVVATEPADGGEEPEPVTLTISKDIHLDPAVIGLDDAASIQINGYLYDGLVMLLGGDALVAGLASSWSVSDDGLTYTFELRPDAFFSDGTQVSADVILDNFNRWFDPAHPLHGSNDLYQAWTANFLGFRDELDAAGNPVSLFDGIEKADNLTVLIHLNEPMENLLDILAQPQFSIINTAVLEAEGDAYGTSAGSAVGSGQYVVSEWTDEMLVLAPNPGYWGTPPPSGLTFILE